MRLGLRGKILLITVIAPVSLGLATLITVHRSVLTHVDSSSIHESLQHSVSVFEGMLAARGRALAGGAEVIARDPRFFSLLTLGVSQQDSRFTATVRGMAHDFNGITQTDLFEVMDRQGRRLASVGTVKSSAPAREPWVAQALRGQATVGVLVQGHSLFQVSVDPVQSDGRIVGALLLGSEIGDPLAGSLRDQMRSEVTFLSAGQIAGTTLGSPGDREALLKRFTDLSPEDVDHLRVGVHKVKGPRFTYVTVVRRIPGSDPRGRQLYVIQRAFDPEITFLHDVQHDLGVLAIVAALAAALTAIILSGKITRPIQELVRGAQEMQRGNYDYPLPVRSSDEIGFLAERFREMRQREQVYVSGLEEAARLKSEFITVASHELRAPISVIQGYRDLLEGGQLGPVLPQQQQALDAIESSLAKLSRIADQATQAAELQGKRLEVHPVVQPVASVLKRAIGSAMAAAPGRGVQVELDAPDDLEPFPLDGDLLAQALTHLVANGIRFTSDGGQVRVVARADAAHLEIQVLDQGPGIPEDRLGHLFDHGYSVRQTVQRQSSEADGAGQGLGIVRGVVEAHGGSVNASNRPEGGTQFLVRIPRVDLRPERRAA
jgi:two-component system sensor histidine kinase BaeS